MQPREKNYLQRLSGSFGALNCSLERPPIAGGTVSYRLRFTQGC